MVLRAIWLFLLFQIQNVYTCMPYDMPWNTTDQVAVDWIKSEISNNSTTLTEYCLQQLLERGYFQASLELYRNYFLANEIEVDLEKTILSQKKGIDSFFDFFNKNSKKTQVWEPFFQWVQSNKTILIQVKFSHRMDAPACLNAKIENIAITENKIFLSAKGIISQQPTHFLLDLDLHHSIQVNESKWRIESVGTLVFDITKADPGLWKKLTQEKRKVNIWWEMRSHFRKDMDEYFQMIEMASEQEKDNKKKNKKKNKEKEQESEPIVVDL